MHRLASTTLPAQNLHGIVRHLITLIVIQRNVNGNFKQLCFQIERLLCYLIPKYGADLHIPGVRGSVCGSVKYRVIFIYRLSC